MKTPVDAPVTPAGALDSPPVGWLPLALREPRRPLLAIALGWLFAFVPSLALSAAIQKLFPNLSGPEFEMTGALAIFLLVVFAPVVETVLMGGLLTFLLPRMAPVPAILISTVVCAVLHSLQAPAWGLVIWWPFLIFSTLFVVWRVRGFWPAVGLVTLVHGLQNLLPALLVAWGT